MPTINCHQASALLFILFLRTAKRKSFHTNHQPKVNIWKQYKLLIYCRFIFNEIVLCSYQIFAADVGEWDGNGLSEEEILPADPGPLPCDRPKARWTHSFKIGWLRRRLCAASNRLRLSKASLHIRTDSQSVKMRRENGKYAKWICITVEICEIVEYQEEIKLRLRLLHWA